LKNCIQMSPPKAEAGEEKASPSPGTSIITNMRESHVIIADKLTHRKFSVSSASGGLSSGSCTIE
jgi:hypothetical protein